MQKNPNVIVGVEYDEERKKMQSDLFGMSRGAESLAYVNTTSYNSLNVLNIPLADYRNRVGIYDRADRPILPLALEAYRQAQ